MKCLHWKELSSDQRRQCLLRPGQTRDDQLWERVEEILQRVRAEGDGLLRELTAKYDGVELEELAVSKAEFAAARQEVSEEALNALHTAAANLRRFHRAQIPSLVEVETMPGVKCSRRSIPVERVGLYIPGGSAVLFSTLLMVGIPSEIAGCARRVVVTPPRSDGSVHPMLLAVAEICGITEIYKVGGAQAIGALAYGTETIPRVDKIFGPGNAYVTAAKMQVSQDVDGAAIDMPAGPSEVLVIADEAADPEFVAIDLLSQAEHDTRSQVLLLSPSEALIQRVQTEIERHLADLPRGEIARGALENSVALVVESLDQAWEISNDYAPEHLILQVENAGDYADKIRHAGSVFLGAWSPEAAGDYASGTNHVLPTYGFARAYSGVTLESFYKTITFQELSRSGLERLGPTVELMADLEELEAHRRAVAVRRSRGEESSS